MLDAGERFGAGGAGRGERVLVEFVSANPTGPLVAASGRHAAYGDALARVLAHHGHDVSREYYFNDAGSQIRLLGESVQARARGEAVPEGGYQGDYVAELAVVDRRRGGDVGAPRRRLRRSSCCWPRSRARSSATASTSTSSSPSGCCTRARPATWTSALEIVAAAGPQLRVRGRAVAAHDHRSATRRTGCCAAPTARRPTSPAISPTCWRSASAGSTCS